jgi:DmsE family decaheme c-type cytochrome
MAVIRLTTLATFCFAFWVGGAALAEDGPGCLDCHSADSSSKVHTVFNTVHGDLNGGGAEACTACHGTSEAHDRRGKKAPPDVSFGPQWPSNVESRNASCQNCHENEGQLLWMGSSHQQENMACDNCHNAHEPAGLTLNETESQALCLDCHTQVRAELHLPSRHPIIEGKTTCTDCHNPHGGAGDADLKQVTLNDNCFSCHQDKRGPFLWEHPPAAEDCALCHRPHGSVNEPLLNARGPALCQQCHAAAFHPSVPYGSEGLSGGSANQNVLGKNCLNCHSQVHGSNHPSGARLTR